MKTITLGIYSFDELSEEAKKYAIANIRTRAFNSYSDHDWEDEYEARKRFLNLAQVRLSIQQSSQGFYCQWNEETNPDYSKSEEQCLHDLKYKMEESQDENWVDMLYHEKCLTYVPNQQKSYPSYVADIVINVCEEIYRKTIDYFEEDYTIDYIKELDLEFLENGKEYIS